MFAVVAQAETLQVAFRPFGNVQNVKVIREKGGALGARGTHIMFR